jgi:hypothetical protein
MVWYTPNIPAREIDWDVSPCGPVGEARFSFQVPNALNCGYLGYRNTRFSYFVGGK